GLLELQDALGRTVESPGLGRSPSGPSVFPPLNVFIDKEGALVVRAEIPGIAPDQVEIQVEPTLLTLSGERQPDRGGAGDHRRERRFGRFSRSVQIPSDVGPEHATADYRDGLLTVRIAKAQSARPRKVEIRTH